MSIRLWRRSAPKHKHGSDLHVNVDGGITLTSACPCQRCQAARELVIDQIPIRRWGESESDFCDRVLADIAEIELAVKEHFADAL